MIVRRSAMALACLFSITGLAYADNTTTMSDANAGGQSQAVSSADQAQAQAQLDQLKQTLKNLETQITNDKTQSSAPATRSLGQLSGIYHKGRQLVQSDSANYFEMMPSTTFEQALLQGKPDFQNGALVMGGYLEEDMQDWSQNGVVTSPTTAGKSSQLALTSLNVDAMSDVNDWVQIFTSLKMISDTTSHAAPTSQFNKAFVTVGNLDKTPFYLTMGKVYIPFGVFGGNGPWSVELNRAYFRANETPQFIVGFFQDGLSSSFSVFKDSARDTAPNFAYNINYAYTINSDWSYAVGASYMNDIIGASQTAIGGAYTSDDIDHGHGINPAIDLNAQVSYLIYTLSGEYNQTLKDNYAGSGAAPGAPAGTNIGKTKAWYVSGSATPVLLQKPTTFMVTYSGAAGIDGIPVGLSNDLSNGPTASYGLKQAWILGVSRPVIKNIIVGVEYNRATTYRNRVANAGTVDLSVYF